MTYEEAVEKINSLLVFGSKPGLERVSELVKRIGSPDRHLHFVHVAGTNGKGSTCALTAAALTAAGYKTGLFISPYVLEFRERFMIDGEMIPKDTLADIVEEISTTAEKMREEGKIITEFEFVLAVALVWYARERCDIVVLETGLGGRFDATNIISCPEVTAITSISLDHTRILGDTYDKIAFEKCGIIKEHGITVAYADQRPEAMAVIEKTAAERKNTLIKADASKAEVISSDIGGSVFRFGGQKLSIRLIGSHQIKNAVTALNIIEALRLRGMVIPYEAVRRGFAAVSFPARLEVMKREPVILLDGAHNPGGAAALAAAVREYLPGKRRVGLVGMLADKDVEGALSELLPLFDVIVTTEPDNPRRMTAGELAAIAGKYCREVHTADSREDAFSLALSLTGKNDALVMFGSLYLASDLRKIASAPSGLT